MKSLFLNSLTRLIVLMPFALTYILEAGVGMNGPEYQLLGEIPGHQQRPHLALGSENGYVVWQSETTGSGGEHILFQSLDKNKRGTRIPVRVSQADDGRLEKNPKVAILRDGGAVVVWEAGVRADRDIYLRIIAPNGTYLTADVRVNSHLSGIQSNPALEVVANGDIVVVWASHEQDGSGTGIYGQYFTALGTRIGAEFRVNDQTKRNQSSPGVASLADEGFVVAWISESIAGQAIDGAPNLRSNLFGKRFDRKGKPTETEWRLNNGDAICSEPVVHGFAEGGFVAAWVQTDELDRINQSDIYFRSFNANGAALADAVRHNVNVVGRQHSPSLALHKGEGLLVWDNFSSNSNGYDVHGRMLSGGAEFRINTRKHLPQMHVTVAADEGGNWLATWVDYLRPRHSILTGCLMRAGIDPDITVGEHVSGDDKGKRLVLRGQVKKLGDSVKVDLAEKAETQLLAAESAADEKTIAAARVAKEAAAGQASNTLRMMAESAAGKSINSQSLTQPIRGFGVNSQSIRGNTMMGVPPTPSHTSPDAVPPGLRKTQGDTNIRSIGTIALANQARSRMSPAAVAAMSTLVNSSGISSIRRETTRSKTYQQPVARPSLSPRLTRRLSAPSRTLTNMRMNASREQQLNRQKNRNGLSTTRPVPKNKSNLVASSRLRTPNGSLSASQRLSKTSSLASRIAGSGSKAQRSQPVMARLIGSGQNLNLEWQTQRGQRYQVQGSQNMNRWQNVGSVRSGTGSAQRTLINPSGSLRYFRVLPRN